MKRPSLERRPADCIADVFPREWIERSGKPPLETRARRAWIAANIERDLVGQPRRTTTDVTAERRSLLAIPTPEPTRTASVGSGGWIAGVLVPFKQRSLDLGGFVEEFAADAFDADARGGWRDVVSLWNHSHDDLLGSVRAGTLHLTPNREGIHYEVKPPRSGLGSYVRELVERGDAHGASLTFGALETEWSLDERVGPVRTVTQAELAEASIVYWPAYPQTSAQLVGSRGDRTRTSPLQSLALELELQRQGLLI